MQILELRMINVKCYEDVTYSFQKGINFISGLNGAGKSTIIESIGFVLFDHLDYTARQFIQDGKRSGEVQVLLEANDQCLYRIIRKFNTNALSVKWEVYHEESGAMLDQLHGSRDVTNWIKENIGLAPEDNLRDLYRQVISVQQGAFTSPFLERPAERRDLFEAILGVEGYRAVFTKTANLNSRFNESIIGLETDIKHIRQQVANLAEVEERLKNVADSSQVKASELEAVSKQHEQESKQEKEQTLLKDKLDALKQAVALDAQGLTHKENQLATMVKEKELAKQAKVIVEQSTIGFQLYQTKQKALVELEKTQEEQKKLQNQLDKAEKSYVISKTEYESKMEELGNRRTQLLDRKTQLEKELKQAQGLLSDARVNHKIVVEQETRIAKKLGCLQEIIDWFKANEEMLDEATQSQLLVEQHLSQIRVLQSEIQDLPKWLKQLSEIPDNQLETVLQIKAKLIGARDTLTQNRSVLEQGICPIIHESCPSNKVAGNLAIYYKEQMAELEQQIADAKKEETLERKRQIEVEELRKKIERAKNSEQAMNELEDKIRLLSLGIREVAGTLDQDALASLVTQAVTETNKVNRMVLDFQKFVAQHFKNHNIFPIESIPAIQWPIIAVTDTETPFNTWLVKFKEQKEQLALWVRDQRNFGVALQDWLTKLSNKSNNQIQLCQQTVGHCEKQLKDNQEHLTAVAITEENLVKQLQQLQIQANELAVFQGELDKYAYLDKEILENKKELIDNQIHYEKYREHIATANRLSSLAQQYQELLEEKKSLETRQANHLEKLNILESTYDPASHKDLQASIQTLLVAKHTLDLELKQLAKEHEQLTKEFELLKAAERTLAAQEEELEVMLKARALLLLMRQVLQEAADPIAQRYRSHISTLASQIYRDISGENVLLEWADQYEVFLKDNVSGVERERIFKQLSGGQQMTAALAIRLALMQTFSDVGVGFFDEPTANLDVERRESLGLAIQKSTGQFNQLFVISHDDTFDAVTENTILVK